MFQELHGKALNYREHGFLSVIDFLSSLPDIVRTVRPSPHGDWRLYDARLPDFSTEGITLVVCHKLHHTGFLKKNLLDFRTFYLLVRLSMLRSFWHFFAPKSGRAQLLLLLGLSMHQSFCHCFVWSISLKLFSNGVEAFGWIDVDEECKVQKPYF